MLRLRPRPILALVLGTAACNYETRDATESAFGEDGAPPPSTSGDGPEGDPTWQPATTGSANPDPPGQTGSEGFDTGTASDGSDDGTTGSPGVGTTTLPGMTVGMTAGLQGCYGYTDEATCVVDGCEWVFLEGAGYVCSDPGVFGTGGGNLCELLDEMLCDQFDCTWDGSECVPQEAAGDSGGESTGGRGGITSSTG